MDQTSVVNMDCALHRVSNGWDGISCILPINFNLRNNNQSIHGNIGSGKRAASHVLISRLFSTHPLEHLQTRKVGLRGLAVGVTAG